VDDIIITSSCPSAIDALLANLKIDFAIKDLGDLHYFLGIEVKKVPNGILLTQETYAYDILHRARMLMCKQCPPLCPPRTSYQHMVVIHLILMPSPSIIALLGSFNI
jgi:hypothetical protein